VGVTKLFHGARCRWKKKHNYVSGSWIDENILFSASERWVNEKLILTMELGLVKK